MNQVRCQIGKSRSDSEENDRLSVSLKMICVGSDELDDAVLLRERLFLLCCCCPDGEGEATTVGFSQVGACGRGSKMPMENTPVVRENVLYALACFVMSWENI